MTTTLSAIRNDERLHESMIVHRIARSDEGAQTAMADQHPRWLSPAERDAWLGLIAVVELLPGALDSQLQRDAGISHFEYMVMAMLSEAPRRTLRMTALAEQTNSTLPRLSHVVTRLVARGYVERVPCPEDKRATNAYLSDDGWKHIQRCAPGHVATVEDLVIDPLSAEQIEQLSSIANAILSRLDPDGHFPTGS